MSAGKRWQCGHGYRLNKRFGKAIKKHGWDSFNSFILAYGERRDDLAKAEIRAIALAGGHNSKYTFNLTPGADIVAENNKPIIAHNLLTGRRCEFESGVKAAKKLGLSNPDMPMAVARGERLSVGEEWYFHFKDSECNPPGVFGEQARILAVQDVFSVPISAIHIKTLERRSFKSVSLASKALNIDQPFISRVLVGKCVSAHNWWFCRKGNEDEMPENFGADAIREKLDKTVYAINHITKERREFRNCTVADEELKLHHGAASSVILGERLSAGDWWFSHDIGEEPPDVYGNKLLSQKRSEPVEAIFEATGEVYNFPSSKLAAEELGLHRSKISKAIKENTLYKGYKFRKV